MIQKYRQTAYFIKQLYNAQIVTKKMKNLQFFSKNVNKQLKSADFFSEMSKFQKYSLTKVMAIYVLISKHTLPLQIHRH